MPTTRTYRLPKDSKAWQQAVDSVASLLPHDTHVHDFDALESLPIFALIVVLPAHVPALDIQHYIQSWVDEQPNWHLVTVAEDDGASALTIELTHETVTTAPMSSVQPVVPAHVFRYLLVPVTETVMHPAKKDCCRSYHRRSAHHTSASGFG